MLKNNIYVNSNKHIFCFPINDFEYSSTPSHNFFFSDLKKKVGQILKKGCFICKKIEL